MEDFIKMDIFFVVTTAVVFLVGLFTLAVLFYIVRILQSTDHIMKNVSAESDNVRVDIGVLRGKIREEGLRLKHFGEFFESVASRTTRSTRKHKVKNDE